MAGRVEESAGDPGAAQMNPVSARALAADALIASPAYAPLLEALRSFPAQCTDAWAEAEAWPLPTTWHTPRRVVMLGVGGSAVGGDIVSALSRATGGCPVEIWRGGHPRADADTLLVACSFSGNTAEALEPFRALAGSSAAMLLALTGGGGLLEFAHAQHIPTFSYARGVAPRFALAYAVLPLLSILGRLGAIDVGAVMGEDWVSAIAAASARCEPDAPLAANPARQLAGAVHGTVPLVLGAGVLRPVSARWAAQINENAKQLALAEEIPEAMHNLVEGLAARHAPHHVTVLDDGSDDLSGLLTEIEAAALPRTHLRFQGSPLARVLAATAQGDWLSMYLAALNGVAQPLETPAITRVKAARRSTPATRTPVPD